MRSQKLRFVTCNNVDQFCSDRGAVLQEDFNADYHHIAARRQTKLCIFTRWCERAKMHSCFWREQRTGHLLLHFLT